MVGRLVRWGKSRISRLFLAASSYKLPSPLPIGEKLKASETVRYTILQHLQADRAASNTYLARREPAGEECAIKELCLPGTMRVGDHATARRLPDDPAASASDAKKQEIIHSIYTPEQWEALCDGYTRWATSFHTCLGYQSPLTVFRTNNTRYIIMPLKSGKNITGLIGRDEAVAKIYIHKIGVLVQQSYDRMGTDFVHLGIKPGNILIQSSPTDGPEDHDFLFIDYGAFFKFTRDRRGKKVPDSSWHFAAPELAQPEKWPMLSRELYPSLADDDYVYNLVSPKTRPTQAADVYSLAALCYYMITGEMYDPARHPLPHPKISPQLRIVLKKALHSDPKQRTQTIESFLTDIDSKVPPFKKIVQEGVDSTGQILQKLVVYRTFLATLATLFGILLLLVVFSGPGGPPPRVIPTAPGPGQPAPPPGVTPPTKPSPSTLRSGLPTATHGAGGTTLLPIPPDSKIYDELQPNGPLPQLWSSCLANVHCPAQKAIMQRDGYWVYGDFERAWAGNLRQEPQYDFFDLPLHLDPGPGQLLGPPLSQVIGYENLIADTEIGSQWEANLLSFYLRNAAERHLWRYDQLTLQIFTNGVLACSEGEPDGGRGDCDLLNIGSLLVAANQETPCADSPSGCMDPPGPYFEHTLGALLGKRLLITDRGVYYERLAVQPAAGGTWQLMPLGDEFRQKIGPR